MTALVSVADYITEARTLLQDATVPYRYSDDTIVSALNNGRNSAVALRPDLFMVELRNPGLSLITYSPSSLSTNVSIDLRYRTALLYYIVGQVQLSDEEDTQDQRAGALLAKFSSQLLKLEG